MKKIIGHTRIIKGIKKQNLNNAFSHASLIIGIDGIGKSVLAKYLASIILGGDNYSESVDIVRYNPTSNSFGVEDVRAIIEEVNKKPYEGDKKIIILYKCNKMTIQAQNALLKTIEEPPIGVYLILLSDSLENILDTIQSRCQVYKLTPLSNDDMLEYLDKNYEYLGLQEKQAALAYSTGIPGKLDSFFKDENIKKLRDICINIFEDIIKRDKNVVVRYSQLFKEFQKEKYDLLDILLLYTRDILIFKELNNKEKVINIDKFDKIEYLSRQISYKRLNSMVEYIEEARLYFNNSLNYSMTISILLMAFAEV